MRSLTSRRAGVSRVYSKKPVTLPTEHLPTGLFSRLRSEHHGSDARYSEHPLVLVREDLDEFRQYGLPVPEDPLRLRAAGEFAVACDQLTQRFDVLLLCHRLEVHFGAVAFHRSEIAVVI